MATKKAKKVSIFDNVDTIIAKAKTINKEAIKTTDMLVEEGLATGTKFQKIFAKSVAKGTDLLEKQQDMAVENLGEVLDLYVAGTKRFRKLFNIDKIEKDVKGIAKKVIKDAENTIEEVEDEITKNSVVKSTMKMVKDAKAKATSIINKVSEDITVKKSAPKAKKKAVTVKKATVKAVETKAKRKVAAVKKVARKVSRKATVAKKVTAKTPTAKKATPVKKAVKATAKVAAPKATKKVTAVKKAVPTKATKKAVPVKKTVKAIAQVTDLKTINGVGPKIETMLKAAGFKTVKDIATAKKSDFTAMLEKAGPRYKMFDANVWIKNAKSIAK